MVAVGLSLVFLSKRRLRIACFDAPRRLRSPYQPVAFHLAGTFLTCRYFAPQGSYKLSSAEHRFEAVGCKNICSNFGSEHRYDPSIGSSVGSEHLYVFSAMVFMRNRPGSGSSG